MTTSDSIDELSDHMYYDEEYLMCDCCRTKTLLEDLILHSDALFCEECLYDLEE